MNNLFNEKLLAKKANDEVDLNKHNLKERRKYLDKWIDMLENGVLDKTKEEQLQGEFISDIFSKLLNATNITDGKDEWNLERETKTNLDGQKADGTLGFFDKKGKKDIRALIELKGANINLDARQKRVGDTRSAVEQAFGYAPKYGANCQWIIVSNFKEIRLYKSNSMLEYQVFFLKDLRDDLEFKKLILLLSFYALVGTEERKAKTLELSEEYQKEQGEIEKKFYGEYKRIRIDVYESMKKNNPEVSEFVIIEKVQKLLDRFLFICFCEDKGLIPANSYRKIVLQGESFGSIFEMFKMFCSWINSGNKMQGIAHFNGGLFKSDSILDNLYIDDEVFIRMEKIADYDFESDLNEAILGHIFEQSISDIEELKSSINDEEFDKKDSKRKKDGIFYTPKYITKYIVENTIGSWIEDKKKELGENELPELEEKDYIRKTHNLKQKYTANYQKHIEFWEKLQLALKNIKVIDPACGSGAFLIEAFDYLLKYNRYLDDKLFELKGTKDLFSDPIKNILENNIFGVDLNKESIEITKLSLWLRTADKNKTLTTLENNIKCGNSLRNDLFNWKDEFKSVFEQGGFDVVIGNPPYVQLKYIPKEKKELEKLNYVSFESSGDLYTLFFEKGYQILKENGILGFITSNKWMRANYGRNLRKYFLENTNPDILIDLGSSIFKSATVKSSIFIFHKGNALNKEFKALDLSNVETFKNFSEYYSSIVPVKYSGTEIWSIDDPKLSTIKNKIEKIGTPLKDWDIEIGIGVLTGFNDAFVIDEKTKNKLIQEDPNSSELIKPVLKGRNIERYTNTYEDTYIITAFPALKLDINKYPAIKKHFENFGKRLHPIGETYLDENGKKIKTRTKNPKIKWFETNNTISNYPDFSKEKILYKEMAQYSSFTYFNDETIYCLDTARIITGKDIKFLLPIFNSKLFFFAVKTFYGGGTLEGDTVRMKHTFFNEFHIPKLSQEEQAPFIEKANIMLELNEKLQKKIDKFKNRLFTNLNLQKTTKKLDSFYELNFQELKKELKKQKVNLTLAEQDEWEEYFDSYKKEISNIQADIAKTDDIINNMVYKLYNLTDEEVAAIS